MYEHLDKHFKNPAEGSISNERAQSNLFETLSQTQQSVINIFWLISHIFDKDNSL